MAQCLPPRPRPVTGRSVLDPGRSTGSRVGTRDGGVSGMDVRARRMTAVLLSIALSIGFSIGLVPGSVSPASADGPTVSIEPDHVVEGQQVTMTISGFPEGFTGLVEC